MISYKCAPLDPLRFPLVKRFYQAHYSAGIPRKDEIIWTIENEKKIIGAVRFRQHAEQQLLTGLLVHPDYRGQDLARYFLRACQNQISDKKCYCFAYRPLIELYQSVGFIQLKVEALPHMLQHKFHRYCATGKDLVPLIANTP